MKFKALLVFLFGIVLSLIVATSGFAGWPVHKTLPIEGRVLDATTGEPIENVVISVGWVKHGPLELEVGSSEKVFRHIDIVTGKDGKYRIPGTTNWFILSSFKNMGMGVYHPLYESQRINIHHETESFSKKYVYRDSWYGHLGTDLQIKHGVVKYDISLLSLEEKYVREEEKYKNSKGIREISQNEKEELIKKKDLRFMPYYGGFNEMKQYFMDVKKGQNIRYDLDELYSYWSNLGIDMYGSNNAWFNQYIKQVKNALEELRAEGY